MASYGWTIVNGSLKFGAPVGAPDGTITLPAYSFASAPNTGMSVSGTNLRFSSNGARVLELDASTAYLISNSASIYFGAASDTRISRLAAGSLGFSDGTSGAPTLAFASETTLGFWRSAAATVTLQGGFTATGDISAASAGKITFTNRGGLAAPANGVFVLRLNDASVGSEFKVDALPTVASGFGTSPAVTAGSTALAGSIDVGTGGVATTGVINFNGTAFPSAPFVAVTCSAGAVPTIATTSTTQLTLTTSAAWPASTKVSWICISSK